MENTVIEVMNDNDDALFNIPTCLHDDDINIIASYKVIPYQNGHGSAGLFMRFAELYASAALINTIYEFNKITGYRFKLMRADNEEKELIISGFEILIDHVQQNKNDIESRKNELMRYMKNINEGRTELTGEEVRDEAERVKQSINIISNRIEKTSAFLSYLNEIKKIADRFFSGGEEEINALNTTRQGPSLYKLRQHTCFENALDSLAKLENSLNAIIAKCNYTKVSNRFQKSIYDNELVSRSAARFYYSAEGDEVRNCMSFSSFCELQERCTETVKKKRMAMSSEILELKK